MVSGHQLEVRTRGTPKTLIWSDTFIAEKLERERFYKFRRTLRTSLVWSKKGYFLNKTFRSHILGCWIFKGWWWWWWWSDLASQWTCYSAKVVAADISGSTVCCSMVHYWTAPVIPAPHNRQKYRPEKRPQSHKKYFLTHFARSLKHCHGRKNRARFLQFGSHFSLLVAKTFAEKKTFRDSRALWGTF